MISSFKFALGAFMGLLVLGVGSLDSLRAAEKPQELVQQAGQAYQGGETKKALELASLAIKAAPEDASVYGFRGSLHSELGNSAKAIADFDQALKLDASLTSLYQRRGSDHFKLGHIEKSIADFDVFLERVPSQEPYHWQRGISYYYAGMFKEGRRQFEIHQTVNQNDVENAVWHFLCVTRESGLKEAQKHLIPISGDSRVPMKQVHDLFAGKAKPKDVLDAAEEGKVSEAARQRHRFYAHLYLGLYFEAIKEDAKAREHILKSAKLSEPMNYMGAVARVHAERLKTVGE